MSKLKDLKLMDSLITPSASEVRVRVEVLRQLPDGWMDGAGQSLSSAGLDWFLSAFEEEYSVDLIQPYLYPTPEGHLLAEWSLGDNACSLDVDLTSHFAEFHNLNLKSEEERATSLNLHDSDGWQELGQMLQSLER